MDAGRVGLVTVEAGQLAALQEGRDLLGAEVKLVVEAQRVRVFEVVNGRFKIQDGRSRSLNDAGVTQARARRLKDDPALGGTKIKRGGGEAGRLENGSLHGGGVGVAGEAGGIGGGAHLPRPLMLDMTNGAATFAVHVGFVEGMSPMTLQAIRSMAVMPVWPRGGQGAQLPGTGLGLKGRLEPGVNAGARRLVADRAIAGCFPLWRGAQSKRGVLPGQRAGADEPPAPRAAQRHQQHAGCQEWSSPLSSNPFGAQTAHRNTSRQRPAATPVRQGSSSARPTIFGRAGAAVAAFAFPGSGFIGGPAFGSDPATSVGIGTEAAGLAIRRLPADPFLIGRWYPE